MPQSESAEEKEDDAVQNVPSAEPSRQGQGDVEEYHRLVLGLAARAVAVQCLNSRFFEKEAGTDCCWVSLDQPIRSVCHRIVNTRWFGWLILGLIIANSVTLALDSPDNKNNDALQRFLTITEFIFVVCFGLEVVIKCIGMGIRGNPNAYFHSAWNWLDFSIAVVGVTDLILSFTSDSNSAANVSAVRLLRILRPLRTVSKVKGMRQLIGTLAYSLPIFADVFLLLTFLLVVFAIVGVQLWSTSLHRRCFTPDGLLDPADPEPCSPIRFGQQCMNESNNCYVDTDLFHIRHFNFDHMGSALLVVFKIVSLDDWPEDMWLVQNTYLHIAWLYFVVLVLVGAYFAVNLFLAVLSQIFTHHEELEKAERETERRQNKMKAIVGLMRFGAQRARTATRMAIRQDEHDDTSFDSLSDTNPSMRPRRGVSRVSHNSGSTMPLATAMQMRSPTTSFLPYSVVLRNHSALFLRTHKERHPWIPRASYTRPPRVEVDSPESSSYDTLPSVDAPMRRQGCLRGMRAPVLPDADEVTSEVSAQDQALRLEWNPSQESLNARLRVAPPKISVSCSPSETSSIEHVEDFHPPYGGRKGPRKGFLDTPASSAPPSPDNPFNVPGGLRRRRIESNTPPPGHTPPTPSLPPSPTRRGGTDGGDKSTATVSATMKETRETKETSDSDSESLEEYVETDDQDEEEEVTPDGAIVHWDRRVGYYFFGEGEDPPLVTPCSTRSELKQCKQLCIENGFVGFQVRNGLAYFAGAAARKGMRMEALRRQRALVSVYLLSLWKKVENRDAHHGDDAATGTVSSVAACRTLCAKKNYGGFSVKDGVAYFKGHTTEECLAVLARRPGFTFYYPADVDAIASEGCVRNLVLNPTFERFMLGLSVLNVIVLGVDHHGIDPDLVLAIEIVNTLCTVVFAIEIVLKVIGLGFRMTFRDPFNRFDAVLVCIGIPQLVVNWLAQERGGSVLSVFRLMRVARVLRLGSRWTRLRKIIQIVLGSLSSVAYLSLLLLLIIFIYSVLGMQLFGTSAPRPEVRMSFSSLWRSLMTVFIVITGEQWSRIMKEMMLETGWPASFYFVSLFIIGRYIILNLFIAIIIDRFQKQRAQEIKIEVALQRAVDRQTHIKDAPDHPNGEEALQSIHSRGGVARNAPDELPPPSSPPGSPTGSPKITRISDAALLIMSDPVGSEHGSPRAAAGTRPLLPEGDREAVQENGGGSMDLMSKDTHDFEDDDDDDDTLNRRKTSVVPILTNSGTLLETATGTVGSGTKNNTNTMGGAGAAAAAVGTSGEELPRKKSVFDLRWQSRGDGTDDRQWTSDPHDYGEVTCHCFPASGAVRKFLTPVVVSPVFDKVVIAIITLSLFILATENPSTREYEAAREFFYYADVAFTSLFIIEVAVKMVVLGLWNTPYAYLRDMWNIVDFVVAITSLLGIVVPFFQLMRAFRVFRLATRSENAKVVLYAAVGAMPSVLNGLVICGFTFILFAILGTQLFKGNMVQCNDPTITSHDDCKGVFINAQGMEVERSWNSLDANFDHVGNALFTLFKVALTEGWITIMYAAVDSSDHYTGPQKDHNPAASLYFVAFVVIANFVCLNLIISILIGAFSTYHEARFVRTSSEDQGMGWRADMKRFNKVQTQLLTEGQKKWVRSQQLLVSDITYIPLPENRTRQRVHGIVDGKLFETVVSGVIIANLVLLCSQHADQSGVYNTVFDVFNYIFVAFYTAECILKQVGYGVRGYFVDHWNRFDFIVLAVSLVGLFFGANLTVFRVLRVGRILRLFHMSKGLNKMFTALLYALPPLFNIGVLLCCVFFVFGVIGVGLYGYLDLELNPYLHRNLNFQNLADAALLLFQMSTGEMWINVLEGCRVSVPHCKPDHCGTEWSILYFVCFMTVVSFLMVNLFVAVVLEAFQDADQVLSNDDLVQAFRDFRRRWLNVTFHTSQHNNVMAVNSFIELIRKTRPPLGPEYRTDGMLLKLLKNLNVPVDQGLNVHYVDVVHALARQAFAIDYDKALELSHLSPVHVGDDMFTVAHVFCAQKISDIWRRHTKEKEELMRAEGVIQPPLPVVPSGTFRPFASYALPVQQHPGVPTQAYHASPGAIHAISSQPISLDYQRTSSNSQRNGGGSDYLNASYRSSRSMSRQPSLLPYPPRTKPGGGINRVPSVDTLT